MNQQEFQNRYTYNAVTDKLGEGGFGSIFKAYDNYRDRWVALKISKVNPLYESVRLRKEVDMAAKLPVHPNIAYYEDCFSFPSFDGEYDFGILQYYEEGNLNQLLKNNTLTFSQKQSILMQILEGLDFLHQNSIIHRDLKPQNILIARRGNDFIPKITDFGISKQLDINKSSVFINSIAGAGTLAFSSPEQLRESEIRKNTDLWSYGVIAFQMFTGKLPFTTGEHASTSEAGRMELFRQINSGHLPDTVKKIPEPWQTVIRRCLETDASTRLKNAQETKDILTGDDMGEDIPVVYPHQNDSIEIVSIETKVDHQPKSSSTPSKQSAIAKKWLLIGSVAAAVTFAAIIYFSSAKRDSGNIQRNTPSNTMGNTRTSPPQTSTATHSPATQTDTAKEEQQRQEAERLRKQKEEQDKIEAERLRKQKEEQDKLEAERLRKQKEKEEQDKLEAERLRKQKEKEEQDRLAAERLRKQKEEQDKIEAERLRKEKEEQNRREAANFLQQASSTFNNGSLGISRFNQSFQLYKKAKDLGGDVSGGYRSFFSLAQTLIGNGSGFDANVKQMLQYAQQLNNTQEVRELLEKCK